MDVETKTILQRIIRKIPNKKLEGTLRSWGRLSAEQLRSLDFTQPKWSLLEDLISRCEDRRLGLKAVTKLEMVYHIDNPDQGTWHACQLMDAEDDAVSVSYTEFRELFKANLEEVFKHISIRMKTLEDGAVWIRIAWGDNFNKPNHLRPTYVVHYLQTPYVFIFNLMSKHKPFLYEALFLSCRYVSIKEAHLSGRSLTALRDLLMKQYQQVFPSKDRIVKERNAPPLHPNIEREHAEYTERRHQMACEAFGDGVMPQLEKAVYKLETRYRGNNSNTLKDEDELFRGVVKFSSTNLLQSLHHCVATESLDQPADPCLSISDT
ncbi:centromere protein N isoform X2 [Brachyhypopomus gauderio]|uniref:centromere protein N isoform X2 n=1 Tax=Brachyhypopomus gauderio TaxID=698409 RepID=UPI0040416C30